MPGKEKRQAVKHGGFSVELSSLQVIFG